jgi:bifunctional non-homologous end joining protein LigD
VPRANVIVLRICGDEAAQNTKVVRLEGLVSKRRDRPYRAGRSPDWIKVKNRSHPALERVKESFA